MIDLSNIPVCCLEDLHTIQILKKNELFNWYQWIKFTHIVGYISKLNLIILLTEETLLCLFRSFYLYKKRYFVTTPKIKLWYHWYIFGWYCTIFLPLFLESLTCLAYLGKGCYVFLYVLLIHCEDNYRFILNILI